MAKSAKIVKSVVEKESRSEFVANVQLTANKANEGKKLSFAERLELSLELNPAIETVWGK